MILKSPLFLVRYSAKSLKITNPTPQSPLYTHTHIHLSAFLPIQGGQGPNYWMQSQKEAAARPLTFSSTTSTVLSTLEMSHRL